MKKTVPVLIEPSYRLSSWCDEILKGLTAEAARREMSIRECSPAYQGEDPLILLGATQEYLGRDTRMLIAGTEPRQPRDAISYVTVDRRAAMYQVVCHLYRCGARRIALLGTDSSVTTDFLRFRGWADAVQELGIGDGMRDAFHTNENPLQCFQAFLDCLEDYDAVACTNDYIALHLLRMLRQRGVEAPRDMMVTGFGDTHLSRWSAPSLTTVSINLAEIGRQAFSAWQYLMKNPKVRSLCVSVDCSLQLRESTPDVGGLSLAAARPFTPESPVISHRTLLSPLMLEVVRLEKVLADADATTLTLLRGIARQVSNERLCEEAFLSYTAFKRRMNKLYQACQVSSKQELAALLNGFAPQLAAADRQP